MKITFTHPRFAASISIRSLFAVAILAGAVAMTTGCHKPVAPEAVAPPDDTAAPPHVAKDEPTKSLPPDLYRDMPIYPGATVEHVRKPKGAMREILFTSGAQMPEMVAYYKDGLKKAGFAITSSLIMPARKTWSCDFSRSGRPGSVMLFPSDDDKSKMTIDLIYEVPAKVDESMLEPREDFDVEGPGEVAQQPAPSNNNPQN